MRDHHMHVKIMDDHIKILRIYRVKWFMQFTLRVITLRMNAHHYREGTIRLKYNESAMERHGSP